MKATPIYLSNGRTWVGEVRGDTFFKKLKPDHFLTSPPAIGFDISTLVDAKKAGATRAQIQDIETGDIFTASIEKIERVGLLLDRRFGVQRALPIAYWDKNGEPGIEAKPLITAISEQEEPKRQSRQLALL